MTQTGAGVTGLRAKEHEGLVATTGLQEEAGRDSHLQVSEGEQPCQHADFGFLLQYCDRLIYFVLSHQVCDNLSQYPNEVDTKLVFIF